MENLSMSLDDLIKKDNTGRGRGKGGGRGRGRGRGGATPASDGLAKPQSAIVKPKPSTATLSSMSAQKAAISAVGLSTGTKLRVANLDLNVSEQDLSELFGELGEIKSLELVTNASGGSRGIAFVVYKRKADAQKAIDTYNSVPLDGKPLKISMATNTTAANIQVEAKVSGGRGGRTVTVTSNTGRGRGGGRAATQTTTTGRGAARGGGRGSARGRGRGAGGRGKKDGPKPTMEDLDADLDNYRSNA